MEPSVQLIKAFLPMLNFGTNLFEARFSLSVFFVIDACIFGRIEILIYLDKNLFIIIIIIGTRKCFFPLYLSVISG